MFHVFPWNTCFITGLPEVDDQHRKLVELINRLGALVTRNDADFANAFASVLRELADYAKYHFAEEESLMAREHLDARNIEEHHKKHADFIDEIARKQQEITCDTHDLAKSLLAFLTHWLAHHILGTDLIMARKIAALRAGASPTEALLSDDSTKTAVTGTLLQALDSLFQQLSERNIELMQVNSSLEARVEERTKELIDANQRLEDLANTDALTGLPNRRYAFRSIDAEWGAAKDDSVPLSCMMIDADGFKMINDANGHEAGDRVLRELSQQLRHAVRSDDTVCRLGGDEFLIICSRTGLDGAMKLAEKIRRQVETLSVPMAGEAWHGSVSIGVASRTRGMSDIEDLIRAADLGVYEAKRNGRNCVATTCR